MFYFRKWLARHGFIKPLISVLRHRDKNLRYAAALGLVEITHPKAVLPLVNLLDDEWETIRLLAAKLLKKYDETRAVEGLKKSMNDADDKVRLAAAHSLFSFAPPNHLWGAAWLVGEGGEREKLKMRDLLAEAGEEAFPPLRACLAGGTWLAKAKAAELLGEMKDSQAASLLFHALDDEDNDVRRAAAVALGELQEERSVKPLYLLVKNQEEDAGVRRAAAWSLARFAAKESLLGHAWMLGVGSEKEKKSAEETLIEAGEESLEPLILALGETYWYIRNAAAGALGKLKNRGALKPLLEAARDDVWQVRLAVAEALGELEAPESSDTLLLLLKDKQWKVRAAATSALSKLSHREATSMTAAECYEVSKNALSSTSLGIGELAADYRIEPLIQAMRDENENVRMAAAIALGDIGDPAAVQELIKALKDLSDKVRAAAAEALGRLKDHAAFEPLVGALNDWYSTVCNAAARSLVRFGPPASLWGHAWLIGGGDAVESRAGREVIRQSGDDAFLALASVIRDWHSEVRCAAAKTMGEMKLAKAVEPLCAEMVRSPLEKRFIGAAFEALMELKQPGTGTQLKTALDQASFQAEDMPLLKKILGHVRDMAKEEWMTPQDKADIIAVLKRYLDRAKTGSMNLKEETWGAL